MVVTLWRSETFIVFVLYLMPAVISNTDEQNSEDFSVNTQHLRIPQIVSISFLDLFCYFRIVLI